MILSIYDEKNKINLFVYIYRNPELIYKAYKFDYLKINIILLVFYKHSIQLCIYLNLFYIINLF